MNMRKVSYVLLICILMCHISSAQLCFAPAQAFNVGTEPAIIISADFNGDGKLDLATANRASNDVSVLLGNGLGSFSTATSFAVGTGPISINSADFNADGKMDMVTANVMSNNISILLGNGTGGFAA